VEGGNVEEGGGSVRVDVVESEGHFGRPTLGWLGSTESIFRTTRSAAAG